MERRSLSRVTRYWALAVSAEATTMSSAGSRLTRTEGSSANVRAKMRNRRQNSSTSSSEYRKRFRRCLRLSKTPPVSSIRASERYRSKAPRTARARSSAATPFGVMKPLTRTVESRTARGTLLPEGFYLARNPLFLFFGADFAGRLLCMHPRQELCERLASLLALHDTDRL